MDHSLAACYPRFSAQEDESDELQPMKECNMLIYMQYNIMRCVNEHMA